MSKRKNYYMVIDTETTLQEQKVFNVGWTICDNFGNIYVTKEFLVEENKKLEPFYTDKKIKYYDLLMQDKIVIARIYNIFKEINRDIKEWNVKKVYAWNGAFDNRVLDNLAKQVNMTKYFQVEDMIDLAYYTIFTNRTWLRNCALTPKGNPSYSAENTYRYLTKDNEFVESHTALDDSIIETYILSRCLKQHKKKQTYEGQVWKALKDRREDFLSSI